MASPAALDACLRDCEMASSARFVADFEDEIAGAEADLKMVKRSYAGTPPKPTEPFDVFHAAFLEAVSQPGEAAVARHTATREQLTEMNTAVAFMGLASRFRATWFRRSGR